MRHRPLKNYLEPSIFTHTHTHTHPFSSREHRNQTSSEVSKFLLKAPNNPTLSVPREQRRSYPTPAGNNLIHQPRLYLSRTRYHGRVLLIIKRTSRGKNGKEEEGVERRKKNAVALSIPSSVYRGGSRFASLRETIPPPRGG